MASSLAISLPACLSIPSTLEKDPTRTHLRACAQGIHGRWRPWNNGAPTHRPPHWRRNVFDVLPGGLCPQGSTSDMHANGCFGADSAQSDCFGTEQSEPTAFGTSKTSRKAKKKLTSDTTGCNDLANEASLDIERKDSTRKRRVNKKAGNTDMPECKSKKSVKKSCPKKISRGEDSQPVVNEVRHVENTEQKTGIGARERSSIMVFEDERDSGLGKAIGVEERQPDGQEGQVAELIDGETEKTKVPSGRRPRRKKPNLNIIGSKVARQDLREAISQGGNHENIKVTHQDEGGDFNDEREHEIDKKINLDESGTGLADSSLGIIRKRMDGEGIEFEPGETKLAKQEAENRKCQQKKDKFNRTAERGSKKRKETTSKKVNKEREFLETSDDRHWIMNSAVEGSIVKAQESILDDETKQINIFKDGTKGNVANRSLHLVPVGEQLLRKEALSCTLEQANSEKERSDSHKRMGKKNISVEPLMYKPEKCMDSKVKEINSTEDGASTGYMVTWIVEATLKIGQQLFVTGASPYLGAWEPSAAIPLSSHEAAGQLILWKGQAQVPLGTKSEYDYFIQILDAQSKAIIWRPGARLYLSVPPLKGSDKEMLVVKDTLNFTVENRLPSPSWGAWWKELGFPPQLQRFTGIEVSILDHGVAQKSEELLDKGSSAPMNRQTILSEDSFNQIIMWDKYVEIKDSASVEDMKNSAHVTIGQAEEHSKNKFPEQLSPRLRKHLRRKVLATEEPWLMEAIIMHERNESLEQEKYSVENEKEVRNTSSENVELLESSSIMRREPGVPAEILINSSECTMERIAILEEGKLVELLLEPVDSEIKVGSVYLGVVKKLLPGMTGVFVDIGAPQIALLSITKNSYPYTFPPLMSPLSQLNGSVRSNSTVNSVNRDYDDAVGEAHHLLEEELVVDVDQEEEDTENDDELAGEEEEEVEDQLAGFTYEESTVANLCRTEMGADSMAGGTNRERDIETVETQAEDTDEFEKPKARRLKPVTVNFGRRFTKWRKLEEGMKIIVQVRRESLGKKGPKLSAFPQLSSRFWVLISKGGELVGVSKKIVGPERKRLKQLAESLRPPGFGLTARTEAAGQPSEELEKDLARLMETWRCVEDRAESAATAAENGEDGMVPVLLHRAMGQTLSVVRDLFAERVQRMVVDSPQTYQEVIDYLEGIAPNLLNRVELYTGRMPIFDAFNLETEMEKFLSKRVKLRNGAYLVIEQTEALVSIDVNGGIGMLGHNTTQSKAILEVNLDAAQQIARELRLRDIGGIIIIDFIDMNDAQHEKLVYEEMRKAIHHDRSVVNITGISELGVMEMTRKRVRPSVTFMISDPCCVCHGTGRVEALETTLCKIECGILRFLAINSDQVPLRDKMWPKVLLHVDPIMFDYLTKRQRATRLSSALKVYLVLKVGRELNTGQFEVSELMVGVEKKQILDGQQKRQILDGGQHKATTRKSARRVLINKREWPYRTQTTS